jgi:hypothetical protein
MIEGRRHMCKLILTLLVTLFSVGSLSAGVLTYTITPNGGQSLYQFTLTNTGDTGGTLFDLFLSLPTDITNIDTTTIGTPVGWGDPTGGLLFFGPDVAPSTSFIEWAADFSGTYDVGIGNSLGGFSLLSSERIGQPLTFALNGSTEFAAAQEVSSVPEPRTFAPLLLMLAVIAPKIRRARSAPPI